VTIPSGVLESLKVIEVVVTLYAATLFRGSVEDRYTVCSKALRHPPGSANSRWLAIFEKRYEEAYNIIRICSILTERELSTDEERDSRLHAL
jgi:hypothetical protein